MKKVLSRINILIFCIPFLSGCSSSRTKLTVQYIEPAKKTLTISPIVVVSKNSDGFILKNVLSRIIEENGYNVIQNVSLTEKIIDSFDTDQVIPTDEYTLINVSMNLNSYEETSKSYIQEVSLKRCNNLRERDKCSYRKGSIRGTNTSMKLTGDANIEVIGEDKIVFEFPISISNTSIIPNFLNVELTKSLEDNIRMQMKDYYKSTISEVIDGITIDRMALNYISLGLFDLAETRVKKEESGINYYFTMGYIQEKRGDYSQAKMFYSEGEVEFKNKIFPNAIKRVDRLISNQS